MSLGGLVRGLTLKELGRDKEGDWIDDIPGGNGLGVGAVRHAMMDDVLRG